MNTSLRDLLYGALMFAEGSNASRWERHLAEGFNARFRGTDIFGASDSWGRAYAVATIVKCGSVQIYALAAELFFLDTLLVDRIRYEVTGRGLSVRYLRGDRHEVRDRIQAAYATAAACFGEHGFRSMFPKSTPYDAYQDPTLIDVQQGVVECGILPAMGTQNPLRLELPRNARLQGEAAYYDLRLYPGKTAMIEGLSAMWLELVSDHEPDRVKLLSYIKPALDAMG